MKLSLGIPLSSQHWYTSQEDDIEPEKARSYSEGVSHRRATVLAERYGAEVRWSERHQVPYAFYGRGGTWEWVFLEDARSFRAKIDLARELGLRDFSAWVLGPEDRGSGPTWSDRAVSRGATAEPDAPDPPAPPLPYVPSSAVSSGGRASNCPVTSRRTG